MLPNKQKNQFYNPILQNKTHMKWMGNYVGGDIPLFSLIVFSERCELKKVTVESPNVKVIKRNERMPRFAKYGTGHRMLFPMKR